MLASLFFLKETPAQVFSCEYCDIFKNTFFHRTPLNAASKTYSQKLTNLWQITKVSFREIFFILLSAQVNPPEPFAESMT